ncbi:MAG: hypothetical protein Q8N48_10165 [Thiobacillus sp.]|nr:hypothetical protein [Thiobacillus sp.]MDP2979175.1 hypothetical protein [Thiobacillus sp.]
MKTTIRYFTLPFALLLAGSSWAATAPQMDVDGVCPHESAMCADEPVMQRATDLASEQCDGVNIAYVRQARLELSRQAN